VFVDGCALFVVIVFLLDDYLPPKWSHMHRRATKKKKKKTKKRRPSVL
jgi:hypothetical protein